MYYLWRAPELARELIPVPRATAKGDIYSFAIICQEIIYRKSVFYIKDQSLPMETIIDRVRAGPTEANPIPLRPTLEVKDEVSEDLIKLISRAWVEDPHLRPSFLAIKVELGKMKQ
ncbi:unnamed protein product [Protopolystoma xenopodis]|uniref:guanylate cyclase n=1 Tax=Protopolystoma xenopodis TaxID=117903 RepID=A0A3S5A2X5_9PLAT|nr:unnamed protein product [Protopolystoma xenopodis]